MAEIKQAIIVINNCSQPVNKLSELNRRVNTEAASHRSDVYREIDVLKNFEISIEKHLCWSLFLVKLQACNFPLNIAKFLRAAFFMKLPVVASGGCF